jgi:chemotaxis protein MotD
MTATAVAPSANQIAGAVAGRPEQAGRRKAQADEEFSGLLSKLNARGEEAAPGGEVAEGELPPTDGDPLKLLKWLAGNKTQPVQEEPADGPVTAADESAAKLLMVIAQATGMAAPAQAASGAAAPDRPPGDAGSARDPRVMLPGDPPMEAEQAPQVKAVQTMAVLKRETHLGSGSAATDSMQEWSARMLAAAQGTAGERQTAPRAAQVPAADMSPAALADKDSTRGLTQEAIAALRNAQPGGSQLGAEQRPGGSPIPARAAEAGPAVLRDAVDQVAGGMRPELTGSGATASAPVQFLAGRIAEEAAALSQPAPGAGSAAAHAHSAVMSPTKVLHIQLQPVELGTVTMKLSLKDNALHVELEVGRGETKNLIQNDRDALTSLLRSAGYLVEGLDVRMADPNPANMNGGGGQMGLQAQSGGSSQTDAHSPGARGQDNTRGNRHGHDGSGTNERDAEAGGRAGVFV